MVKFLLLISVLLAALVAQVGCGGKVRELYVNKKRCAAIRDLHFRPSKYLGSAVCVKGKIIKIGKHDTYIEVKDQSGVIITNLSKIVEIKDKNKNGNVYVEGALTTGPLGIPYINADRYFLF